MDRERDVVVGIRCSDDFCAATTEGSCPRLRPVIEGMVWCTLFGSIREIIDGRVRRDPACEEAELPHCPPGAE
jgi:hypothetical protein